MDNPMFSGLSLSALPVLPHGRSRAVTAENPHGEKGRGGTAASPLGPSRKGRPCITLAQGETAVLADMDGPGVIRHFWMTVTDKTDAGPFVLRDLVLRFYWDGEQTPSAETPLGDFFCCGFATGCLVNSLPIAVNPKRGFNCYFAMPFRRHAKITVENQHAGDIGGFFFQFDYTLYDVLPQDTAYFHAQWRRERLTQIGRDYTVLDNVSGRGLYVGTYLALSTLERYWYGEGEMKFFIDGDKDYPTLCGTGTEDYFGGAWSFTASLDGRSVENNYCTPFLGYPFYSRHDTFKNDYWNDDCPPMRGMYRWHIPDPIFFEQDLRVTLQQIGVNERGLFERSDDVSTVAYWYQSEPHGAFPVLPEKTLRWPR